ncbi:MAG: hypothetical protein M3014_08425 [Chloroflexota bacterium]|nr:hypothetical protein [Chloroflexota bacterium]
MNKQNQDQDNSTAGDDGAPVQLTGTEVSTGSMLHGTTQTPDKPSQAEGDRDTINEDIREKEMERDA